MPTLSPIQTTLYGAIADAPVSWETLVLAVSGQHKVRKNGWMAVRGHLQGLINAGLVARVDDIHSEDYVRVQPTSRNVGGS